MNLDWQSFWIGAGSWAVFGALMGWIFRDKLQTHLVICDSCKEEMKEGPYR